MQLRDTAQYDLQVFDGDRLLYTQPTTATYVVLMTPAADRWMVKVLQQNLRSRIPGSRNCIHSYDRDEDPSGIAGHCDGVFVHAGVLPRQQFPSSSGGDGDTTEEHESAGSICSLVWRSPAHQRRLLDR